MNRRHFIITAVSSALSAAAGLLVGRARGAAEQQEPVAVPPSTPEEELEWLRSEVVRLAEKLRESQRKCYAAEIGEADALRENRRLRKLAGEAP